MRTSNWQFWAIIALPVIYAIVFAYIPMGGIVIAFKDYSIRKGIFGSDWVGLKYFKQFLTSTSSVTVIKNTVILGIYTLVVNFPIPILLAIGINEIRNKTYKKTIQMITYAPYFISVVVLVGMMMQMMDLRSGVINMILQKLGMNPINFFGDAGLFRSLYVWSGVWQTAGYSSIIYSPFRCEPGTAGGGYSGRSHQNPENYPCGYSLYPSHHCYHADIQLFQYCKYRYG